MTDEAEFRPRLFIGGLKGVTEKEDIKSHFEKFGEISDIWVAYNPPGFAFVEYADMESAKKAKDEMHLAKILDTEIRVELTKKSKGERNASKEINLGANKPRLFVGGLKKEVESDEIKALFETLGEVVDIYVAPGKGYAFVEYGSMAHAKKAIAEFDQSEQFGGKIRLEMSNAKSKGGEGGRGRGRGGMRGRGRHAPYPAAGRARPGSRRPPPSFYEEDSYYGAPPTRGYPPRDPNYDDYYAPPPRARDPFAARRDPYAAGARYPPAATRDPYYDDPYAADPYAADPYARPVAAAPKADPYAEDPYARPPARAADPYAADPYAADPYARAESAYAPRSAADPYAVDDPYAADSFYTRDPYARRAPADPYAYAADPYAAAPEPPAEPVPAE